MELLKALDIFLTKANPEWKQLHRIADKLAPKLQQAFMLAVIRTQSSATIKNIETALEAGQTELAVEVIDWYKFQTEASAMGAVIDDVMRQSMEASAKRFAEEQGIEAMIYDGVVPEIPEGKIVGLFNLRNPEAEKWVKKHVGDLVTQITEDSKQAIRSIALDGFENGNAPKKMAREIRQYIGLTDRDTKAVLNYRAKLEDMLAQGESPFKTKPLTHEKIDSMVDKYGKKKLRERSELIARTETIKSSNMGLQTIWEEAQKQGLISQGAKRKWITAKDERVCSWCGPLHGNIVGMREDFTITANLTEGSKALTYTSLTPPLHPACRCSMVLADD